MGCPSGVLDSIVWFDESIVWFDESNHYALNLYIYGLNWFFVEKQCVISPGTCRDLMNQTPTIGIFRRGGWVVRPGFWIGLFGLMNQLFGLMNQTTSVFFHFNNNNFCVCLIPSAETEIKYNPLA